MVSFLSLSSILLSLGISAAVASPHAVRERAIDPTVTIASGVVVGTTTQYPGATATANKFLGVPFAKSPPLRFGLPEPAARWTSPLSATAYKPKCFQQGNGSTSTVPESEDCLYANVFTPPGTTASSGKTVMLWIYGGNLQAGSATEDTYDGSLLAANHDVVVVSFGYRLNAFGFSGSPGIPLAQRNVGFYDQRFALQWVQSNIAAFGGDPSKVTIWGWSAGGYSVKYLLALPPSGPLPYRAAILQSEATIIPANGTDSWNALAAALNCQSGNAQQVLACVRAAPATSIQSVVNSRNLGFPPQEDNVSFVNDAGVADSFASGRAANVPVFIGSNGQELSVIPFALGLNGAPLAALARALGTFIPFIADIIADALQRFVENNVVYGLATQLFTQAVFQCPAARVAEQACNRTSASGSPVWRYYYNASFPNTEVFPGSGAYHGAELPEVWGTYPRAGATAQQISLSAFMRTAWSNFAKNPAASGPGWERYGSDGLTGDLGANGASGEVTLPAARIDTLCPLLDGLGVLFDASRTVNGTDPATGVLRGGLLRAGGGRA